MLVMIRKSYAKVSTSTHESLQELETITNPLCPMEDLGAEEYIDFTQTKDIAAEVTKITKYGAHGCIVYSAAKQVRILGQKDHLDLKPYIANVRDIC